MSHALVAPISSPTPHQPHPQRQASVRSNTLAGTLESVHSNTLAGTLDLVEERRGNGAAIDGSGEVAERDGSTLRLKEGGAFYAPSPVQCVAVHWPKLVAGAQSGELYHLEVQ